MDWSLHVPALLWCFWITMVGLGVGSFLNVLIARLPYEKSILWPGSRCGACLRPIRTLDNIPIIGFLRLRGRCRDCGATFSSRYLWVELGTGVAFLVLFLIDVLSQAQYGPSFLKPWYHAPGLRFQYHDPQAPFPPLKLWIFFAAHAFLVASLIACALIDAEHRIIPPQMTYLGTILGLIVSTAFPWPWPSDLPAQMAAIPLDRPWLLPEVADALPTGIAVWPFWGPPPAWAPLGSWQLGLLNGLIGAAVGTGIVRLFKFLFEVGFGQEALGLGDADLLMMVGAFLGWQVVVIGFFAGAIVALLIKIPAMVWSLIVNKESGEAELPFGPGLVIGVVATWFGWPWVSASARVLFDPVILGMTTIIMTLGLLASGLILRRR